MFLRNRNLNFIRQIWLLCAWSNLNLLNGLRNHLATTLLYLKFVKMMKMRGNFAKNRQNAVELWQNTRWGDRNTLYSGFPIYRKKKWEMPVGNMWLYNSRMEVWCQLRYLDFYRIINISFCGVVWSTGTPKCPDVRSTTFTKNVSVLRNNQIHVEHLLW